MGLSITTKELKHILKTKKLTFKMHGFEPQNMFTIMNTMMNDPEIQKFAKNFEEQMKNSMEDFKKSKTVKLPRQPKTHAPPLPLPQKLLKTLALHQKLKTRPPAQCFKLECAIQEISTENRHQTLFQSHYEDSLPNRFN